MIRENPRPWPPWVMVAFQSMSCSGVELGQSEKSGKVEGRSKTVLVSGAPSPCAP